MVLMPGGKQFITIYINDPKFYQAKKKCRFLGVFLDESVFWEALPNICKTAKSL